jgi:nicotinate phosphoribosyltransferase
MEMIGKRIIGVRIDSGDLAYLSKKIRKILDENNLKYVKIIASNDIDEHILESLKLQGSRISVWGIGTKLVTAHDNPSLGAVYKLSAIKDFKGKWVNKIKLSEQKIKINNPGVHQVRRFKNNSKFMGDMIYDVNNIKLSNNMIDPNDSTKSKNFKEDIDYEDLLVPIFKKGKCIYKKPSLDIIKSRLKSDLSHLDESHKRLKNPHIYPVGLEKKLFDEKKSMIIKLRKN